MTASSDVKALLRQRYTHPEWAICFEVANSTGAAARRYADAVAMSLYPSRGLAIHGFEIKVSKSDFKNEVANPDKSVAVQQYCDHWWIVAPANAVDESLLPATWGWLRVDGGRLVAAKNAPKLEAKPADRHFMAAMIRRANEADDVELKKIVDQKLEVHRARDREYLEREIASRTRANSDARKDLDALKEKLGSEWGSLDNDAIVMAIRMLKETGVTKTYDNLRNLEKQLKMAVSRVSKALDGVYGKQIDMLDAAE